MLRSPAAPRGGINRVNDIREGVTRCFAMVFPGLRAEEIPRASSASLAAWDSVAQVNLLTMVAEAFQVEFALEEFAELTSFAQIVQRLEERSGHE